VLQRPKEEFMSVFKVIATISVAAVTIVAMPRRASADWLLTPYIGGNFGGSANFGDFNDFDDEFERRVTYGASLGWMGAGIAGFEIDFGRSPNFFENTLGSADFDWGESNVTTFMGSVVLGAPVGGQSGPGFRPYAAAGLGLIRASATGSNFFDDLDTNDFGLNVGGGVHGFFNDNVGLRGDIRYLRSLQDNEPDDELDVGLSDFRFWRATVGVTFRFGN
jgi:opacity protein-like surface antigen